MLCCCCFCCFFVVIVVVVVVVVVVVATAVVTPHARDVCYFFSHLEAARARMFVNMLKHASWYAAVKSPHQNFWRKEDENGKRTMN